MKPPAFLFPLGAILLWAGNVAVSKLSASAIDPSAITFYRLLLAIALMCSFTLRPAWRNRAAIVAQWPKLALLGFLAMALFQSLSYEAAKTTSATNMAIITALVPLMTMALGSVLLGETPAPGMVAGGLVSLAGVVWLITRGAPQSLLARGVQPGDLLMIGAAAAYALYGVLLKRWRIALPVWQSTLVQACAAAVCMVPMMLRLPHGAAVPTRASLPLILYAGGLASVVLPALWLEGVRRLGPSRCAMFMNLLPVATALLAIGWLGESLQAYHLVGGGIALAGVLAAQTLKGKENVARGGATSS
ncbi:DMT family transporter [Burkholderia gladioli]|uniref:EamA/RhaT family transporter n=3 Tax=Burkholderia gladioli TaxID=28095 RepID=A0A2A7SBL9_BURGA|nr:DMT family transporter [Burkholderia gladioli]AEA65355.1 hypothetical protein bgla_2g29400 [Burkholderia gladioli BSR3]MBU9199041.1 DMT family transporter [Burkholderia gladioli]MBU9215982.1 DMT family transporter [Burkholderia gladioli]MBU9380021.1 DMT family transporter [Burkholderia gladioli]MBU9424437.1 DMT family transporter [Burkholderia gladioli]